MPNYNFFLYNNSDYEKIGEASGVAHIGTGLWTSICIAFTNIFGISSKSYETKLRKVKNKAVQDMASNLRAGEILMNVTYALSNLTCIARADIYKVTGDIDSYRPKNKRTYSGNPIQETPILTDKKDEHYQKETSQITEIEETASEEEQITIHKTLCSLSSKNLLTKKDIMDLETLEFCKENFKSDSPLILDINSEKYSDKIGGEYSNMYFVLDKKTYTFYSKMSKTTVKLFAEWALGKL